MNGRDRSDRYEPLPGVADLPAWLWRRMGLGVRIAVGAALLAVIALGVALAPGIRESNRERGRSELFERAKLREQRVRQIVVEQRPRFRRYEALAPAGASPSRRRAARAELMGELSMEILADARRRVRLGELNGKIRRVECEPFPAVDGRGADGDLRRRRGRFSCLAVTAEIEGSATSVGVVTGHPYRSSVNFETGHYAYCKLSGQPVGQRLGRVPRACG